MLKAHVVPNPDMLKDIPGAALPKNMEDFWYAVAAEYYELINYACTAREPEIVMRPWRKAGEVTDQYIWEFYVNDLAIPVRESHNWHGQNTSQWKYSGAIVLYGGEVSRHH